MHTAMSYQIIHFRNHFSQVAHRCMARFAGCAVTVLLFAGLVAHNAHAQAPALGDHFIFFVDGVSLDIEEVVGAEVVDDPDGSDNKVLQLNHGQFSYHGFFFVTGDTTMGGEGAPRDMTANRDAGNVLHFRIRVDPANPNNDGQSDDIIVRNRLAIQLEDYGENIGEDGNNQFRLRWAIADSLRDGEWHEVSVQLPPATWDELEAGKADGTLSGHEAQWIYAGSWAGFEIGLDLLGPDTAQRPDLWTEFEWNNVRALGIQWDWNEAGDEGAPIYLDDVFIGPADFDLGDVSGLPAAMSGVMVRADGGANVVSWTHNPDFGGYNVYFSGDPITDVSAEGVSLLQRVSAAPYEVRHEVEVPYSFSSSGSTLYYAVTSLSASGTENPDVSNSAVEIDNPDLAVSPAILSLTDEQAEALFEAVNTTGTVTNEPFPEGSMPFVVDDMHSQLADSPVLPDNNDDLSASVWVAYYGGNDAEGLSPEVWIYAEVTDDLLSFSPAADGPEGAWQYDSIEFGWGNYDVRDAGGSVLGGSPHTGMMRGAFPDYQFRLSPHGSATDATAKTNVDADGSSGAKPNLGGAAYESATDGYRMLAFFPTPQVKYVGDADANFPGENDDPRFMPFTVSLNDRDGGDAREHQITWSLNPAVNNNWWKTPNQWQTVTMIHSSQYVPVSSEDEPELPEAYALAQNYPNPFNPATTIRFQLPQAEQVTLRVFDVLGREVAALLDNTSLAGGEHTVRFDASGLTSGVYLYRLEAGASFVQTRRMILVK